MKVYAVHCPHCNEVLDTAESLMVGKYKLLISSVSFGEHTRCPSCDRDLFGWVPYISQVEEEEILKMYEARKERVLAELRDRYWESYFCSTP